MDTLEKFAAGKGKSLEELCEATGISKTRIEDLAEHRRFATLDDLLIIARVIECDASEILPLLARRDDTRAKSGLNTSGVVHHETPSDVTQEPRLDDDLAVANQPKTAQAGTLIFKRADVVGLIRKLIADSHSDAEKIGETGDVDAFLATRRKVAGYYEVLNRLHELPVFENTQLATRKAQS